MDGLPQSKYKERLRLFWTREWKYGKTPEEWVSLINKPYSGALHLKLVDIALHKLERERKILPQQRMQMWEMLKSPDEENHHLVLHIMAGLKPKKFKIIKSQVI